ncbi:MULTISPECIES: RrF2 family transcriptional regulator [Acidocella]|uniref:RrF2 family transcriptional regulator n=1 Tax=Acidocella TaxID=50709 RepID=UPI00028E2731|nr:MULTISPECIES: Rrf2 family transcriptional regulator [Acidocella]EKN00530.1 BadM/Rrf2 family transcriptional regulator [Acidocella sp. MX-AZ02]WBO60056.1 Rrf2 family transcriptional regulator [Acidocella sp. MX-AZ03]
MLSQKCKYALQALMVLAREKDDKLLLVSEIAERENLPKKFLEAILLELNRNGLVRSRRGRGGGYALAKPADLITFGQVVRIMDGPLAPLACVSVNYYRRCDECRDEQACEIRKVMRRVRDAIANELDGTSLAKALADGKLPADLTA